jgi:hypothetical protein
MKTHDIGKLVTPRKIPNHIGKCNRIYSIPETIVSVQFDMFVKTPQVVDKLFYDEIAIILNYHNRSDRFLVLSPRSITGWCNPENLIIIIE